MQEADKQIAHQIMPPRARFQDCQQRRILTSGSERGAIGGPREGG